MAALQERDSRAPRATAGREQTTRKSPRSQATLRSQSPRSLAAEGAAARTQRSRCSLQQDGQAPLRSQSPGSLAAEGAAARAQRSRRALQRQNGQAPFDPNRTDRWRPKGPPRERSDRDTRFSGKTGKPPFDPNRPPRKPWGSKPGGARGKKPWGAKPGGPARKPWAGDRDRRPEPRGDRRPPNGPSGPKREWRADGPPKRRKDEDE